MLPAVVYCPVLTVGVKSGHRQSEQNVLKRPFILCQRYFLMCQNEIFILMSKRDLYSLFLSPVILHIIQFCLMADVSTEFCQGMATGC